MSKDVKVRYEWYGDQIQANIETELETTIKKATLDLKRRSSEEAPIDKGDLRGNASAVFDKEVLAGASTGATVEMPGERLTGRVGYSLPYALRQHEELDYKHPMGGKAKYLEDPGNRMAPTYEKAIMAAAGRGVKGK